MSSRDPDHRPRGPQSTAPGPLRAAAIWPLMLVAVLLIALHLQTGGQLAGAKQLDYSTFQQMVASGEVGFVNITDRRVVVWAVGKDPKKDRPAWFAERLPVRDENPAELLEAHNVPFTGRQPSPLQGLGTLVLLMLGMALVFTLLLRRANPAERAMAFGKVRTRQYVERDTKTTFADVAGIDEPKQELQEIVEYLREPGKFRRLGGRIPKGVLLVGAPGTGKTLLAKAVAGEAQVPFFSLSGSDFVEMFVGVGASRVRDLFRQAEQQSPCIVFIDELDALGKVRGASLIGGGHDEREQTLNQLLVEMDGFDSNLNVIVMAATNRPEILDPALLRPGRFDRQVAIPRPDIAGREAILRVHAQAVTLDPAVDLRRIAARTPGYVGADLANVINEAALLAARRGRDAVQFDDLDEAVERVTIGLERRSHVISEGEKRVTAYHEAGHAIVALFSEHADPVQKVSIIPRGVAEGYTLILPEQDRHNLTEAELGARLAQLLGGRLAEEQELEVRTTGAASDLQHVTRIARAMVCELGMSALGPLHFEMEPRPEFWGVAPARPFSEETARQIDLEVARLVSEAVDAARAILSTHRAELQRVAERLLEVEVLDQEELYPLVGLAPPHHAGDPEPAIPVE